MPVETLNCPMCGAAASSDSPQCEHCGARLATVSCPSCFGLMFLGAKFCSHCGAAAARADAATTTELCPRCQINMQSVRIGQTPVEECPKCEGLWIDGPSLQVICADREEHAVVLGMATSLPDAAAVTGEQTIRYVPCPVCKTLMNRINFAHCSGVIVDVCAQHGTWFDKDELRRIIEFIRAGGLDKSRAREMQDLESRRRLLDAGLTGSPGAMEGLDFPLSSHGNSFWLDVGVSAVGALLRGFLK